MKKQGFVNRMYAGEWGRIAAAFLLTAVLFVLVSLVCPRVFFINDDENIMYTLSGYYTYGVPYDHSFVNFCLSYVLRAFYRLIPGVQWYSCFHMSVLIVSVTLIFKTILREFYKKGFPFYVGILVDAALFAAIYLFPTTLMQFTTTSAFAGAAAVVLLFGVDFTRDRKGRLLTELAMSVIMLVVCYVHRRNTGYVVICFYLGTAAYQFVSILAAKYVKTESAASRGADRRLERSFRWRGMRKLLVTVLAAALLLGAVIRIDAMRRSTDIWTTFYEYDNTRFKATDYPHDSYEDNPALYGAMDWSPELYELGMTNWWFFMDPRINADSFTAISETGFYESHGVNVSQILSVWQEMYCSSDVSRIAVIACAAVTLGFVVQFLTSKNKKRYAWEFVYGACIALGSILLCLFLCYRQRLPLRAFHTICLPFVSVWMVLMVRITDLPDAPKRRRFGVTAVCAVSALLIVGAGYLNLRVAIAQAKDRVQKSERTIRVEEYAMEHPDELFVYDTSLTFRYLPFTVYTGPYPSNLFFWGGMGWNSPAFYEQLRLNGLDDLYSDVFLEDNVYYITWDDYVPAGRTIRERLEAYMDATYGDCYFELVDSLGSSINVYKIIQ